VTDTDDDVFVNAINAKGDATLAAGHTGDVTEDALRRTSREDVFFELLTQRTEALRLTAATVFSKCTCAAMRSRFASVTAQNVVGPLPAGSAASMIATRSCGGRRSIDGGVSGVWGRRCTVSTAIHPAGSADDDTVMEADADPTMSRAVTCTCGRRARSVSPDTGTCHATLATQRLPPRCSAAMR
jgi:hypothetical protein